MSTPAELPPSDHQLRYLRDLASTHALYGTQLTPEQTLARVEAEIADGLTREGASRLITQAYRAKPHPTAKSSVPLRSIEGIDNLTVPEGCYAVLLGEDLKFYRIYTPTSGEAMGETVIRRYASENLTALYPAEIREALTLIDADPDAAAYRFSDEYTRCYVCTRVLTDAVSRLLSIGPDCRGFSGHRGLKAAAREVDHDRSRREVYRALRDWALAEGFRDPRNKDEREQMAGAMTAARVASAWAGLPGMVQRDPADAVVLVRQCLTGQLPDEVCETLTTAAPDTALDLIGTGILTQPMLAIFFQHPNKKVREAAGALLLDLMSS